MEVLPPEMIEQVCSQMNVTELENFLQTSIQHYNLCFQIYEAKKRRETLLNAKQAIVDKSFSASQIGRSIDVTNFNIETRKGIRILPPISPQGLRNHILIQGTNIYLKPEKYNEIIELLNYN